MKDLTNIMKQLLQDADIERGVINNVPLATAYALEDRMLITDDWHKGGSQTTAGGDFPRLHGVKLTAQGIHAARELKGVRPDA